MKFIQFFECFESFENDTYNSYNKYTISYIDGQLNEEEFISYFLNIKHNIQLSIPSEYKNKKTIIIAPRTDYLPSWSSICKNIFEKAGFPIEIVLKTRCFILRDDAGIETPPLNTLYDRMTEEVFEFENNTDDTSE